ncbi:DNA repair protein RadC [Mesonia hippocampi]|uniref:DNA repair protein RadC n=1 Tax=Mesonia hippocampi TaxID=1628250 RepID=A0A840EKM0_9FLAO|nr:DNA repair protein RadC [Mesonia hippocampi]MBB4118919.1 DNA repair protein RadC [Mesonia hippocampi]
MAKTPSFSIKKWAVDDRPREKLLLKGKESLSDAELIAILIGSGNKTESAVELSKRILADASNKFNQLGKLTVKELITYVGIGEAKAISIIAALEIGRRRRLEEALTQPKITSSSTAFEILKPILEDLPHEEFWILYLNNANKVLQRHQLSKGGITGTLVDVRLIFKQALSLGATAIIAAHNHPSGKLTPSRSDIEITKKLKLAGKSLDIKLLDHLIVTQNTYLSFADEGLLE